MSMNLELAFNRCMMQRQSLGGLLLMELLESTDGRRLLGSQRWTSVAPVACPSTWFWVGKVWHVMVCIKTDI